MEIISDCTILETEAGKLGIRMLTESADYLAGNFHFSEMEKIEFQSLKNETRRREYLAVRILVEAMLGRKVKIEYSQNGKPLLKNYPLKISISHSADMAIVLLSEKNIGADVEKTDRNTERVATRFLSVKELNCIQNSPNPSVLQVLYWSAKEAAFKFSDVPEIEFKEHIVIHPFELNPEGGKFSGILCKKAPPIILAFHYLFFQNNVIVCCVEEESKFEK